MNTAALYQHRRESDEKLRSTRDEITKNVTASKHQIQAALNSQMTQQKHELTVIQTQIAQTSTQLRTTVTAHKKEITAVLNQHKTKNDEKLRATQEVFSKHLTASNSQIQTALNTQLTQQKHELIEKLSANEQNMQTQVAVLTQTCTQLQATVTAHEKETTVTQYTLEQRKSHTTNHNHQMQR